MHPQPAATYCEIRRTDNKGVGLFAKIDIKEGTVISDEINIKIGIGNFEFSAATWQDPDFWQHFRDHGVEDLETAVSGLISYYKDDVFQQTVFDRLSRSIPEDLSDKANLMFTNCLSPKSSSPPNYIIFGPTTCALNHSCISNATLMGDVVEGDPTKLRYQVMALKDIEAQTEITVSYGISDLPTAERRLKLRDIFRFDCVCEVCMDQSIDTRENYAIVNRLLPDITAPSEHEIKRRTPWRFFQKALELAETYHKLGIVDSRFAKLWETCASVAAYHSDAIRTHHCLMAAATYWTLNSPGDLKKHAPIMFLPTKHPQWGHSDMGLSDMEDIALFRDTEENVSRRIIMAGQDNDGYDRIMPKEEAEQKRQAALLVKEALAEEAASQLLAEEGAEKGKKPAAAAAKKAKKKKKRKQKGKKAAAAGEEKVEEVVGPASAGPDVRLNAGEEGEGEEGTLWEEVEGKKSSQQRAKAAPAAPVAKKEKKKMVVPAAPAVAVGKREKREEKEERQGEEEWEKGKEGEKREEGGREFSVGEAAVAGEKGTLRRLRAYSQPVPFSSAAMYDEDRLVLPGVGREFSWWCGAYADKSAAQK